MNMGRKNIILSAISLLFLTFILTLSTVHVSAEEKDNTIVKGVFIDEVEVSGMTKEQAEEAVKNFVGDLKKKGVAIMVGSEIVYTTMGDLGYQMEDNENIETALSLGKSGNLVKRYKDMKDIEQGSIIYPLTFIYDETKIKDIVEKDVSAYNIEPVNATIKRKNGEFIYGDHIVGKKVNVDATVQAVATAIDGWNRQDIIIDAVIEDDLPIYTKDVVEQCNKIIGTYTTQYADSAEGRAANLANGARLINNAVLYPGDVFSAYEYLTPFTEDNGYFVAGAYLQGKVIDSVGGGACQVTTTLYNAILQAELEVVERQPHSMTISYVDLSRDAAIAGTYKDFKFKNNTDVPILIEATTKGRTITFKVWGKETRDTQKREVEYVTVVLSETKPPADVVTKDPSQPDTYRKVTQSAHTGYKAELYKVVKENGVEVSRTLVNKSNYAAAPKYVTVGTKKVEDEKDKEDKNKPKNTDEEEDQQDQTDIPTDSQSTMPDNGTNPDGRIQADIWNELWDEGYED
jgi:vancomycin resistance protein YoaR